MEDTVVETNRFRTSKASHEVQVCYTSEADLQRDYKNCAKNPGHTKYYSPDEFDVNCLPEGYKDNDLAHCIMALSGLTVLVTVPFTSNARPDVYSGTSIPYPDVDLRGRYNLRTGTGWLRSVTPLPQLDNSRASESSKGENSAPSFREGAQIVIRTATHVVFDDEEGKHTICQFFFDSGSQPRDCKGVIAIKEPKSVVSNINYDWSDMTFVIYDEDLASKLDKMVSEYPILHQMIWDKHPTGDDNQMHQFKTGVNFVAIVSHPHGCHKHISFGMFRHRDVIPSCNNCTQYSYTTPTCSGSSGAPVFILGMARRWAFCSHPHSGRAPVDGIDLNFSGVGYNEPV